MLKTLILIALLWNLVTLYMMYSDKKSSRTRSRRIPEKTLLIMALAFGGIGVLSGMYLFRHKTRHLSFVLGVPTALIFDILLIYALLYRVGAN